ncbi:hypothetical protein C2845_PM17G01290 [Panicum miliaceum]|uniref:Uncharacterized protein n=1 Tax=Panicum miliaceum TaxID=4540 RepID=A0A3L6Q2P0_PANMI|nr:hypothetical protein C2845_PM17G01290 [Panicum miliaceum]
MSNQSENRLSSDSPTHDDSLDDVSIMDPMDLYPLDEIRLCQFGVAVKLENYPFPRPRTERELSALECMPHLIPDHLLDMQRVIKFFPLRKLFHCFIHFALGR